MLGGIVQLFKAQFSASVSGRLAFSLYTAWPVNATASRVKSSLRCRNYAYFHRRIQQERRREVHPAGVSLPRITRGDGAIERVQQFFTRRVRTGPVAPR